MFRELNRPSSQTLAVFREFRQWLEYLHKNKLEKEFDSNIKAHSQRQATRISKRFDELYQKCEAGDRSVRKEMKELLHWSKLYPALVRNLGSAWFSEAQDRVALCGIPNWEGIASMSQSEAILTGYSGSAEITWVVDSITDDVVRYVATAKNVQVDIASGNDCIATVNSVEPNIERSFLVVNYSVEPVIYSGMFMADVNYTITCSDDTNTISGPFSPIMYPTLDAALSSDNNVISGTFEDASSTYSSTWNFIAVPRTNP